ncbi:MAG TPA: hypothetical protein VGM73_02950 [Candidatus Didemnitutus sp.]|jgi:hypothetical protein
MKGISLGILMTVLLAVRVAAAPVTNADIEKLLGAGMSEDVIVNVIKGGERQFDTSPDALIALKSKGATPAILAAMTASAAPAPGSVAPPPPGLPFPAAQAQAEAAQQAQDTVFIDNGKRTTMIYSETNYRMAGIMVSAIAFGFGRRDYWSIPGQHAQLRTENQNPAVLVSVPRNSRPEQGVTLTRWEPRNSGNREILIDKSKMMGDSVTIQGPEFPPERIFTVEFAPAKDDSGAPIPDRYEVRSRSGLPAGEYAIIVMHRVYDFGVDPPK